MHATPLSRFVASGRHTRLIVAAVLGAAVLAAAAAVLMPPPRGSWAAADPQGAAAAIVPVGIVGESSVAGDPSVPSAESVFKGRTADSEAQADTF